MQIFLVIKGNTCNVSENNLASYFADSAESCNFARDFKYFKEADVHIQP